MAYLTQKEFHDAIGILATEMGLQRLQNKLVQLNALVSRRGVSSAETLASRLYMLTSGLRRQVPATVAFHGVWGEMLGAKLGEDGEKQLEELAKTVNECLSDSDEIIPEKAEILEGALGSYGQALASKVGEDKAYLDMLLKAVSPVAKLLREKGIPAAPPPAPEAPAEASAAESQGGKVETPEKS